MLHTKARYVGEMFCFVDSALPLSVSSCSTRPRSLAPGIAVSAAKTLGRARASLSGECFLLCPYFERRVSGCREIEATLWAPTGDFCFYLRDDVLLSAFVCLLPRSSVLSLSFRMWVLWFLVCFAPFELIFIVLVLSCVVALRSLLDASLAFVRILCF